VGNHWVELTRSRKSFKISETYRFPSFKIISGRLLVGIELSLVTALSVGITTALGLLLFPFVTAFFPIACVVPGFQIPTNT